MRQLLAAVFILFLAINGVFARQTGGISGTVLGDDTLVQAQILIQGTANGAFSDNMGFYTIANLPQGTYTVVCSYPGYRIFYGKVEVADGQQVVLDIRLQKFESDFNDVVITGNLKEGLKTESVVPVESYSYSFLQRNPTNNVYDALRQINGIQGNVDCGVCNTGDIEINGLEGHYTLVLIDGVPLVSGLSTVYGFMGIPNSLIERVEVIKGPASTQYGTEAMAGIVNVITKNVNKADRVFIDARATSYLESDVTVSGKVSFKKVAGLFSGNAYNFNTRWDLNKDNFIDIALTNRYSAFTKWTFNRKQNRAFNISGRYLYEDRLGGEMQWQKPDRGTENAYGDNIINHHWELFGDYQLPVNNQKLLLRYGYAEHYMDAAYGTTNIVAKQRTAFGQFTYDKEFEKHNMLTGINYRFTFYDDNMGTTYDSISFENKPMVTHLPGVFVQDEIKFNANHQLYLGLRYDYNSQVKGHIVSPRANYKWTSNRKTESFRIGIGNGYRVANIFMDEHESITGGRRVIIAKDVKPEQSINTTLNYTQYVTLKKGFVTFEASMFFTYFLNIVNGDFDTDPNAIIYDNADEYAIGQGISFSSHWQFEFPLRFNVGVTLLEVYEKEGEEPKEPLKNVPTFTGTFGASYTFAKPGITLDWTGYFNSPMRLNTLPNDYRPGKSPWYTIQNIQCTKTFKHGIDLYFGINNIFNVLPRSPIMRPFDPFDKTAGDATSNPNGYTFDTGYNYAPNQGIKGFIGLRYKLR
jgi:outer membrane receptor for ferrienterochelin and colicins